MHILRRSYLGFRAAAIAAGAMAGAAWAAPALALGPTLARVVGHEPDAYVRVDEDAGTVRLHVATRVLEPGAKGGPRVALVGAVHVGQHEYYAALQDLMATYDVVLFEGVGGGPNAERLGAARDGEPAEEPGEKAGERAAPRGVQARLAEALGLEFQLEVIDYSPANWRNSDMTLDEVRAELAASPAGAAAGERIFGALAGHGISAQVTNLILRFVQKSEGARQAARVLIIDVLEMSDEMLISMPGGMGDLMRVLIVDRNEKVLTDLRAIAENEPDVRSVAIFYGAGHLIDMETSLVDRFGYVPGETTWFSAIEADLGDDAGGIAAMRAMIRSSMQMQIEMMRRAAESGQGTNGAGPER